MGGGAGGRPTPGREEGDTLSELIPPAASATLSLLALLLLPGVLGSNCKDSLPEEKQHFNLISQWEVSQIY